MAFALINARLQALLDNGIAGLTVLVERPVTEALNRSELPAIVIRAGEFEMQRTTGANEMLWEGSIDLEIFTVLSSTETSAEAANRIAANAAALVWDDMASTATGSLGLMLTHMDAVRRSPNEDASADQGGLVLTFLTRFFTPADDWNAIIGPNGLIT